MDVNSYIVKPLTLIKFIDVATHIELYWVLFNTPAL